MHFRHLPSSDLQTLALSISRRIQPSYELLPYRNIKTVFNKEQLYCLVMTQQKNYHLQFYNIFIVFCC